MLQLGRQRGALVIRHHHEKAAVRRFFDPVDGPDIGMIQRGGSARLPQDLGRGAIGGFPFGGKEFQRHRSGKLVIERLVDDTHASSPEFF